MKVTGSSTLAADRATVWRALNDPAVLVRTIPGCTRLEALGDDAFAMTVSAGVGAVTGVYDGQVRLSEQEEPGSFRMHAQGAGAPGTIGAEVQVTLAEGPDGGTSLTYEADAVVGGMIGGVGQRMLTGVSKRMAEEFFRNVETALTAADEDGREGAGAEPAVAGTAPAKGTVYTAPPSARTTFPPFAAGVAAGAAAALAGVLIGAWVAGRRAR
jgi:uncharacterized protein